ncbi:MAG TPA: polysaccharide pyruvyl transferase family protein [Gammaproteobacteria bacterium]|nr:polysaccharide pyruvyl transferase family protein [Gammaproteobacteria bacterium]
MVVFDVVGVNYVNKGAQLMLHAIREQVARGPYPAVTSLNFKLARHGRRQGDRMPAAIWLETSRPGRAQALVRHVGNLLPSAIKKRYALVSDKEISVILDASGFLYSDQWGSKGLSRRVAMAELWRDQGKKLILLPQAFGPFERAENRALMGKLVGLAELVYARDQESYDYLAEVAPGAQNLRLAPDFTNLVKPVLSPEAEKYRGAVAVVPNQRMLDKQSGEAASNYQDFMVAACRKLREAGKSVFLLLHERGDRALAAELQSRLGNDLDIVFRDDPVELKGIIGQCDFIFASRFHAIVSALSQGVPVIGTSWSHKYRRLYEDYGANELLISTLSQANETFGRILADLCQVESRDRINQKLAAAAQLQKQKAAGMWDEIFAVAAC